MYNYIDTAIMKKLFLAFVLALGFGAVASAGDTYAHDASVLPQSVGEQPDIAHAHRRTHAPAGVPAGDCTEPRRL